MAEILDQAQADLAAVKEEFRSWIKSELDALDALVTAASAADEAAGCSPEKAERAFRAMHDIKGLAATFDLPLATSIANAYCRFAEADSDIARRRLDILAVHVDAIRAALKAPSDAASEGAKVLEALQAANTKALSRR